MTETTDLLPVTEDNVRLVLNALGAPIRQYAIRGDVDWVEVERLYGPRFKGAALYHYEGVEEYDDNSWYMAGEVFALVAPTVQDPAAVIKECFLSEMRAAAKVAGTQPPGGVAHMYSFSLGEYSDACDDALLWQHGIVFAYKSHLTQGKPFPNIVFSEEEQEEIEEFFG
jgi:hypothetical protein